MTKIKAINSSSTIYLGQILVWLLVITYCVNYITNNQHGTEAHNYSCQHLTERKPHLRIDSFYNEEIFCSY